MARAGFWLGASAGARRRAGNRPAAHPRSWTRPGWRPWRRRRPRDRRGRVDRLRLAPALGFHVGHRGGQRRRHRGDLLLGRRLALRAAALPVAGLLRLPVLPRPRGAAARGADRRPVRRSSWCCSDPDYDAGGGLGGRRSGRSSARACSWPIARDRLGGRISDLAVAALRDPLTGLLNRRGFEDAFDVELERARRTEQSLSVIVGDLDGFERASTTSSGTPAGDEVLRAGRPAARVRQAQLGPGRTRGRRGVRAARAGHRRARRVHPGRAGARRHRAGLRGRRTRSRSRPASAS